jgi:hypothetical protein
MNGELPNEAPKPRAVSTDGLPRHSDSCRESAVVKLFDGKPQHTHVKL